MGGMFSKPDTPDVPDYEEEKKKEEDKAAKKKKSLLNKGRSGTMLGGSTGDDAGLKKAKLGG